MAVAVSAAAEEAGEDERFVQGGETRKTEQAVKGLDGDAGPEIGLISAFVALDVAVDVRPTSD